jgi:cellulose synthase/poly-beta-1,6-N-acetylglucosamine synthase-like glycosyltransferase
LKFQTYQDFEIVISEDGNDEAMGVFIRSYNFAHPFLHLTQADEGWRKNKALNNAVRNSSGDYLVFIDGDCVLHHRFMENHLRLSQHMGIVAGKRIKLGPIYSRLLIENINQLPELEKRFVKEFKAMKKDGAKFYEEVYYFHPDTVWGIIPKLRRMKYLKGCNMSFFRSALEAINGFDEDYILPATGEDADLWWRFKGLGYKLISARNLAVQYHLYHHENWIDQSENLAKMERKKQARQFVCRDGLKKNGVITN